MAQKAKILKPLDRLILESLRDIHSSIALLCVGGLAEEAQIEITAKNLYRLQEVCTILGEPVPNDIGDAISSVVSLSQIGYPLSALRKLSEEISKDPV